MPKTVLALWASYVSLRLATCSIRVGGWRWDPSAGTRVGPEENNACIKLPQTKVTSGFPKQSLLKASPHTAYLKLPNVKLTQINKRSLQITAKGYSLRCQTGVVSS